MTYASILVSFIFIVLIWLSLPEQRPEPMDPDWAQRSRLMCSTSETQEDKDFWCN